MLQKNKTINRNNRKGRLAAVLALAVLLGAAPAVKTEAVDLSTQYPVTVKSPVGSETDQSGEDSFAELSSANVVLDFYQVAAAKELPGYDAYEFDSWAYPFRNQETEWANILADAESNGRDIKAEEINELTQRLAGIALSGVDEYLKGSSDGDVYDAKVAYTGTLDNATNVDGGLYLIIAHGSNIPDYKVTTTSGEFTTYSTVAKGKTKLYYFAPMLVSVPIRGNTALDGEGIIAGNAKWTYQMYVSNTANTSEDWSGVEIYAKAGEGKQYGKLSITKELSRYETQEFDEREDYATVVIGIEAKSPSASKESDPSIYSNVVSLRFSGKGTSEPVVIDKLPVGSVVYVKELYASADYKMSFPPSANVEAPPTEDGKGLIVEIIADDPTTDAEEMVSVTFTNDYDDTFNGGGSVTNFFNRSAADGTGDSSKTYADGTTKGLNENDIPATN